VPHEPEETLETLEVVTRCEVMAPISHPQLTFPFSPYVVDFIAAPAILHSRIAATTATAARQLQQLNSHRSATAIPSSHHDLTHFTCQSFKRPSPRHSVFISPSSSFHHAKALLSSFQKPWRHSRLSISPAAMHAVCRSLGLLPHGAPRRWHGSS
jgi:hypothetical protein